MGGSPSFRMYCKRRRSGAEADRDPTDELSTRIDHDMSHEKRRFCEQIVSGNHSRAQKAKARRTSRVILGHYRYVNSI